MSTLTCTPTIDSYGNELSYIKPVFPISNMTMTDASSIGSNEWGSAFGYDSWTGNIEDYYDIPEVEGFSYELKALLNLFPKVSINITGNTRATGKTCILFPSSMSVNNKLDDIYRYIYTYRVFALYSFDGVEKLPYVGRLLVACNNENTPIDVRFVFDEEDNYDFWCKGIVDSGSSGGGLA